MIKVAVIAGTPVDTKMGVDFIEKRSRAKGHEIEAIYLPVSDNCDDQTRFQYSDEAGKRRRMDELFDPAIGAGVRDFFIYCNSLSGAFDFETYARDKGVNVYTPLQVYRKLAKRFRRAGVIAANNISAYNIEKTMLTANDDLYVIGSGNMAIVSAIEQGLPPEDIVRDLCLEGMVHYMEACGSEVLILGCTHFPYLKEVVEKICRIPLIDPADEMYDAVMQKNTAE